MRYLIWSIEHNAWWAPNSCGYTKEKSKAGIYAEDMARKICISANHLPNKPNEALVPIEE